jgi:hypothetical protein
MINEAPSSASSPQCSEEFEKMDSKNPFLQQQPLPEPTKEKDTLPQTPSTPVKTISLETIETQNSPFISLKMPSPKIPPKPASLKKDFVPTPKKNENVDNRRFGTLKDRLQRLAALGIQ